MTDPFLRLRHEPQGMDLPEVFAERLRAAYLVALESDETVTDGGTASDSGPAVAEPADEALTVVPFAPVRASRRRRRWLVAAAAVVAVVAGIVAVAVRRDDDPERVTTIPPEETSTTTSESPSTTSEAGAPPRSLSSAFLNGTQLVPAITAGNTVLTPGTPIADAPPPAGPPQPCPGQDLTGIAKAVDQRAVTNWNGPNAPFGVAFTQWTLRLPTAEDSAAVLQSLRDTAGCPAFEHRSTQGASYPGLTLQPMPLITPAGVAEATALTTGPTPAVAWATIRAAEVVWIVRLEDAPAGTWLTPQKIQDMVHLEAGFVTRALPPVNNISPGPAEVDESDFAQVVTNPDAYRNAKVTLTGRVLNAPSVEARNLSGGSWVHMLAGPDQAWPVVIGLPGTITPANLQASSTVRVTGTLNGRLAQPASSHIPFPFTGVALQASTIEITG